MKLKKIIIAVLMTSFFVITSAYALPLGWVWISEEEYQDKDLRTLNQCERAGYIGMLVAYSEMYDSSREFYEIANKFDSPTKDFLINLKNQIWPKVPDFHVTTDMSVRNDFLISVSDTYFDVCMRESAESDDYFEFYRLVSAEFNEWLKLQQ